MINIAHRGANRRAIENSFKAFDLAIQAGSQRIEFDIWECRDGHFPVMHDSNLKRTTGHFAQIKTLTRREFDSIHLIDGQKVPFLDDIIEKYIDNCELNIEMKDTSLQAGENLGYFLKTLERKNLDRIIVSSFNLNPLLGLQKQCPLVKIACLVGGSSDLSSIAMWQVLNFTNELSAKIVHPYTRLVGPNFMDQAKNRGWKVYTYSGLHDGEEKEMEKLWTKLKDLGVDGHCTNFPDEFALWSKR